VIGRVARWKESVEPKPNRCQDFFDAAAAEAVDQDPAVIKLPDAKTRLSIFM
jgi:hypothetical protein